MSVKKPITIPYKIEWKKNWDLYTVNSIIKSLIKILFHRKYYINRVVLWKKKGKKEKQIFW